MSVEKQLSALLDQKTRLANNLMARGAAASPNDGFATLIPKVLDIPDGAKPWNDFILSGYRWGRRLFAPSDEFGDPFDIEAMPPLDTSAVTDFSFMFAYCNNITKAPELDTSNGTNFREMFNSVPLTEFPDYDFSNAENLDYAFASCKFKTVPPIKTGKCTGFYCTFQSCSNLETVEEIDFSSVTNSMYLDSVFEYCTKLANLTITGVIQTDINWYSNNSLTRDSLLSVINALKDYSGTSTTKTFSVNSEAFARLTEEDIATATLKGWTVAEC